MKNLMRWIAILALCYCCPTVAKKPEPLSIGYYALPPHAMNSDGRASGAAVRFIENEVFDSQHYSLEWKYLPFARVLEELKKGTLDCGILIAKTAERSKDFVYPRHFLHKTQSGIVTLKSDTSPKFDDLNDLDGIKLGHVVNSVRPKDLIFKGVKFEDLSGEDSFERNILKLTRQRIDGVYVPTLSHAKYQIGQLYDLQKFALLNLPYEGYKLYVVFRKDIEQSVVSNYDLNAKSGYEQYLAEALKALTDAGAAIK